MIKQSEIIQEPWMYPGKVRQSDFHDELARAKKKYKEQVAAGEDPNPETNPNFDVVKSGEYVEPKDGNRAEWRHLWLENRGKTDTQQYTLSFNDGFNWADEDTKEPSYPPHPTLGRDGKGGGFTEKEKAAQAFGERAWRPPVPPGVNPLTMQPGGGAFMPPESLRGSPKE